jgi:hypothetical protein
MAMADSESTEYTAQSQPWRTGQGQEKTALDPSWDPGRKPCEGNIAQEADTKWWWCNDCGYVGWGAYTKHLAPKHPKDLLRRSLEYFYERRAAQGVSKEIMEMQAMHLQAVALRVAASMRPDEMKKYIDEHVFPPDLI